MQPIGCLLFLLLLCYCFKSRYITLYNFPRFSHWFSFETFFFIPYTLQFYFLLFCFTSFKQWVDSFCSFFFLGAFINSILYWMEKRFNIARECKHSIHYAVRLFFFFIYEIVCDGCLYRIHARISMIKLFVGYVGLG